MAQGLGPPISRPIDKQTSIGDAVKVLARATARITER